MQNKLILKKISRGQISMKIYPVGRDKGSQSPNLPSFRSMYEGMPRLSVQCQVTVNLKIFVRPLFS